MLTRVALWLILATAMAPTVSRVLAWADPASALALADVCLVRSPSANPADADNSKDTSGTAATAVACLYCVLPALPGVWPLPAHAADFSRPEARLRPVQAPLLSPRSIPLWRDAPPRAPPRLA